MKFFHKKLFFILAVFFAVSSIHSRSISQLMEEKKKKETRALLNEYLDSIPVEMQIAQVFLINIEGDKVFTPVEKYLPGGVILFSYNVSPDYTQLASYIKSIGDNAVSTGQIPPFVSIDQEGGIVNRLAQVTSYLPSNQKLVQKYGPEKSFKVYEVQAKQMKALGFDMNIAPVCEAKTDINLQFLDTRSYGKAPEAILYSTIAVNAYEKEGISTVIKHFPGNTATDPHTGLPELNVSRGKLWHDYICPFAAVIKSCPQAVLMSHAKTTAVDGNTPACLSEVWINEILKNELGYKGLVISDDIFMAALKKNGFPPEKASVLAIEAGVDIIMISEKRCMNAVEMLKEKAQEDKMFAEKLRNAQVNVLLYKTEKGLVTVERSQEGKVQLVANPRVQNLEEYRYWYKEGIKLNETE